MTLIPAGIYGGINEQYSHSLSWVVLRATKSRKQTLMTPVNTASILGCLREEKR